MSLIYNSYQTYIRLILGDFTLWQFQENQKRLKKQHKNHI